MPTELFYHAEPFDVACNLAGNELDVKDFAEAYLELRDGTTRGQKTRRRAS